jgi:hypothetical protein
MSSWRSATKCHVSFGCVDPDSTPDKSLSLDWLGESPAWGWDRAYPHTSEPTHCTSGTAVCSEIPLPFCLGAARCPVSVHYHVQVQHNFWWEDIYAFVLGTYVLLLHFYAERLESGGSSWNRELASSCTREAGGSQCAAWCEKPHLLFYFCMSYYRVFNFGYISYCLPLPLLWIDIHSTENKRHLPK